MGFEVKVLADSLSTVSNSRLTTLMMTYPRIIHSEHLRHLPRHQRTLGQVGGEQRLPHPPDRPRPQHCLDARDDHGAR